MNMRGRHKGGSNIPPEKLRSSKLLVCFTKTEREALNKIAREKELPVSSWVRLELLPTIEYFLQHGVIKTSP